MKWYPLLTASLLFFILSCRAKPGKAPAPDPEKMKANYRLIRGLSDSALSGDLIFRNGMDEVSRAARSFNRKDTSYSHCGLLMREGDSLFVYHALGGSYNPSQRLMRQPLDSFCNPTENNSVAVYRYPLSTDQLSQLKKTVTGYYKAGLPFDLYFNYQSDDKMYCAEFVFKSLNRALDNSLSAYVRMDTIPFGVTTDDLFLHPSSRLVKKEKFIY